VFWPRRVLDPLADLFPIKEQMPSDIVARQRVWTSTSDFLAYVSDICFKSGCDLFNRQQISGIEGFVLHGATLQTFAVDVSSVVISIFTFAGRVI